MVRSVTIHFGSPDFAIEAALGPRTREVLNNSRNGETFVIKRRSSGPLSSATTLATGKQLTAVQIELIRDAANEPRAFYNGRPIFRRPPPDQDFAIRLHADCGSLDLMIGLHNPSWGFYCGAETYQDWHWVGDLFSQIAKDAFPQFASPSNDEVWRKGAIAELERHSTKSNKNQLTERPSERQGEN